VATYKILTGLDYGKPSKRAEIGDVVSDLPSQSISWLLEQNCIELADSSNKKSKVEPLVAEEEVK